MLTINLGQRSLFWFHIPPSAKLRALRLPKDDEATSVGRLLFEKGHTRKLGSDRLGRPDPNAREPLDPVRNSLQPVERHNVLSTQHGPGPQRQTETTNGSMAAFISIMPLPHLMP